MAIIVYAQGVLLAHLFTCIRIVHEFYPTIEQNFRQIGFRLIPCIEETIVSVIKYNVNKSIF